MTYEETIKKYGEKLADSTDNMVIATQKQGENTFIQFNGEDGDITVLLMLAIIELAKETGQSPIKLANFMANKIKQLTRSENHASNGTV